MPIRVAILILSYNSRADLPDCLTSVAASLKPAKQAGLDVRVYVVDNASTDGSAQFVRGQFPLVHCISTDSNLGFAGGNNFGWQHIQRDWPVADYLVLLNPDTIVAADWLAPLVAALTEHDEAGAAQAKILLHPQTDHLNTAGNRSHYLGFGYSPGGNEPDRGQFDQQRQIDFPSGAAMIVRCTLLRELGLFEPDLFLYLEDAELGWRLRQVGQTIRSAPASVVYHKHDFTSTLKQYYYLERNRWWLLLVYYKWPTLLLLLPAMLLMELGQLGYALSRGVLGQKLRSVSWFLHPANFRSVMRKRKQVQARRTLSDRAFMGDFSSKIAFAPVNRGLMRWVANPILGTYWQLARKLIVW